MSKNLIGFMKISQVTLVVAGEGVRTPGLPWPYAPDRCITLSAMETASVIIQYTVYMHSRPSVFDSQLTTTHSAKYTIEILPYLTFTNCTAVHELDLL